MKKYKYFIQLICMLVISYSVSTQSVASADELDEVKSRTLFLSVVEENSSKIEYRGTGYILDTNGLIVTASHVLENAQVIYGQLGGKEGTSYELELLKKGDYATLSNDIALLRLPDTDIKIMQYEFCDPQSIDSYTGYSIKGLGFPWGAGFTVSHGNIGIFNSNLGVYQASGDFAKGMSGGPVINTFAQLVGIILGGIDGDGSLNYILPTQRIFEYSKDYLSKQPEMFCYDGCEQLGKTIQHSCRAYDKSGFHSSPSGTCRLKLEAPAGTFFKQNQVKVISEAYRKISGLSAVNALKPEYSNQAIVKFAGKIGCTNSQGTGRTCESSATVAATYYPMKCFSALN